MSKRKEVEKVLSSPHSDGWKFLAKELGKHFKSQCGWLIDPAVDQLHIQCSCHRGDQKAVLVSNVSKPRGACLSIMFSIYSMEAKDGAILVFPGSHWSVV